MKKAIVLFSSGLDSWCNLLYAIERFGKANVRVVFFNLGQQYYEKELNAARQLITYTGCYLEKIDLRQIMPKENTVDAHIPFRNTFMLLWCVAQPNIDYVLFGMLKGETPEDKNPAYMRVMQKLVDSQYAKTIYRPEAKQVRLLTPFSRKSKTQMIKWYVQHQHPLEALAQTIGCFHPYFTNCGNCISCFNRWVAFENNDVVPKGLFWTRHPFYWGIYGEYTNSEKVPLKQLWLKKLWLLEIYRASNKFCRRAANQNFLEHMALRGHFGKFPRKWARKRFIKPRVVCNDES